jgi:hypothetical protein
MARGMILLSQPRIESLIEISQRDSGRKRRQKLLTHPAVEPFNFALALGLIRLCVYQGDTQRCGDMFQMLGSIGGSIVHVQFAGKPSLEQSIFKCVQKVVQLF